MKSQIDMKTQLEETKGKIKELLIKYGFPTYGVNINPIKSDSIQVQSGRDDIQERINMTIRRSEHNWNLTMSGDEKPRNFKDDEEKMLEFIENILRELVKC